MSPLNYDEILTCEELAEYLKMTPAWVRESCRRKSIPFRKIGRQYRFFKTEIDTWLTAEAL